MYTKINSSKHKPQKKDTIADNDTRKPLKLTQIQTKPETMNHHKN